MLCGWKTNFCCCVCAFSICAVAAAQDQNSIYQNGQANGQQQYSNQAQPNPQQQQPYANQQSAAANAIPLTAEQQAAMQQAAQENELQQVQSASIQQPQQPFADLPPEESEYLHKFLDYWQQSSDQVKQYVCEFQRFEYDPVVVNWRDPNTNQLAACSIAIGEIRFANPDKGFYETTQIWDFKAPPQNPGEKAEYEQRAGDGEKEKWICDGRNIFEFDFENKRLYETEIPKEMQGEGIVDSPIPFLFGANKKQILERYWVRIVPKGVESEFWLEAYPKRIEDARLYSKIEVIVAKEDFLPKAMHVYSPQYDPAKNNFQTRYFSFENRKVNDELARLKDFLGHFVRPSTPILGGWKRVTRNVIQDQQAGLPDGLNPNAEQSDSGSIR